MRVRKMVKKLGMFFAVVCCLFSMTHYERVEAEESFKDVKKSSSHYESIMYLHKAGVYGDKTGGVFAPNSSITRNEVVNMLYTLYGNSFEEERVYKVNTFSDVSPQNANYYPIVWSYEVGIFDGKDGRFDGEGRLTRAQLAKILVNTFDLERKGTHPFPDVKPDHWAFDYVSNLYSNGVTTGNNGDFMPEKEVTNGQFASFIYRTLQVTEVERNKDPIEQAGMLEASISYVHGDTFLSKGGTREFKAEEAMVVSQGDTIRTEGEGTANILFENGSKITLGKNTKVVFSNLRKEEEGTQIQVDVVDGAVWNSVEGLTGENDSYVIGTETAMMEAHGTLFLVRIDPESGRTTVNVFDGIVGARSPSNPGDEKTERQLRMNETLRQNGSSLENSEVRKLDPIDFTSETEAEILAEILHDMRNKAEEEDRLANEYATRFEQQGNDPTDLLESMRRNRYSESLLQLQQNVMEGINQNKREEELNTLLQQRKREHLQELERQLAQQREDAMNRKKELEERAAKEAISRKRMEDVLDTIPNVPKVNTYSPRRAGDRGSSGRSSGDRGGSGSTPDKPDPNPQPDPKPDPKPQPPSPPDVTESIHGDQYHIEVSGVSEGATLVLYDADSESVVEGAVYENGRFIVAADGKSYYVTQIVAGKESKRSNIVATENVNQEPDRPTAPQLTGSADGDEFYIVVEGIASGAILTLYDASADSAVEGAVYEDGRFIVPADGKSYSVTQTVDGQESDRSNIIVAARKPEPPTISGSADGEYYYITIEEDEEADVAYTLYKANDQSKVADAVYENGEFTVPVDGNSYYVTKTVRGQESEPSDSVTALPNAPMILGSGSEDGDQYFIKIEGLEPDVTYTLYHANEQTKVADAVYENGEFIVPVDGKSYYVTKTVGELESGPSNTVVVPSLLLPPDLKRIEDENIPVLPYVFRDNNQAWRDKISEITLVGPDGSEGMKLNDQQDYAIEDIPEEVDIDGDHVIMFNPELFQDEGSYTITIKAAGYEDVTLTVEGLKNGLEPGAETVELSATSTSNSITLTWDNTAGYNEIWVQYDDKEEYPEGGASEYTITDLTPATEYTIRVEFRMNGDDFPRVIGTATIATDVAVEPEVRPQVLEY
ncbi:S-layer homology domain-containing protein [Bacillus piscicola]|uniref:S-layer homology domain-containing protein n=1 Tax=Bacillus piscicola TaxID=1632684 RepID=UPI001F09AAD8|nr:S-layer homology domain-containing protein [Bacillus piscicola]